MFSLGRKNQPFVGIDISSTSVKLIELSKSGGRYKVESYGVEPLPADAVVEKNISDIGAVTNSLTKVLKRADTKTKRCALAVPTSSAISKVITMPADLSEDEMEGQIQLEADQYVPYPLDEVNLDFEVLGANAQNPASVDVLLVAARQEIVESRCSIAEASGLVPTIVDVESFATANAYRLLNPDGISQHDHVVAVIDVGASMTSVTIINQEQVIYSREQPFGGRQLTEEIMRRYGLSYAEAGLAKKEGGLPDNYVPEILMPFKETLVQQAQRLLQFFSASGNYPQVAEIVLAGGTAGTPGLDELIEQQTGIKTSIANPFSRMNFDSQINQQRLGNDAPALMIAVGLAMRTLD